jgi:hypothetical protein
MALTRRAAAATLAGLALAGAAASPAHAYWHSAGQATGSVPTAAAAPNVITLTLSTAQGNRINAAGNAGTSTVYGSPATVTVVLCRTNTWPCPSIAATLTITAAAGAYTVLTPTGTNFKNVTVYGRASQTQSSGWIDYSAIAGPLTP